MKIRRTDLARKTLADARQGRGDWLAAVERLGKQHDAALDALDGLYSAWLERVELEANEVPIEDTRWKNLPRARDRARDVLHYCGRRAERHRRAVKLEGRALEGALRKHAAIERRLGL